MANIAELKSLRADFGQLDNFDSRLTDMVNSMAALECKVADVKRDVSSHTKRVEEAESCIHEAENSLEKNRSSTRIGHQANCLS